MNVMTIAIEDNDMVDVLRKALSAMKGVSVLSTSANRDFESKNSAEDCEDFVSEQEVDNLCNAIPADLMQAVAEQAHEELKEGRCTPLDDVVAQIHFTSL